MSALNDTYTLSNAVQIPKLGLGTWFIDDDTAPDAVRQPSIWATAISIRPRLTVTNEA